jgi:TolA-binding protein
MPKAKMGVVSLLTSVPSKRISFYGIYMLLFLYFGCHQQTGLTSGARGSDERLFRHAAALLENGDFEQAHKVYTAFLAKFPDHEFADDAAYRLAYLHVFTAEKNPYFGYQQAQDAFERFIEKYPESNYTQACRNWLALLTMKNATPKSVVEKGNRVVTQFNPEEIRKYTEQIFRLEEENQQLKEALGELQKAIQR